MTMLDKEMIKTAAAGRWPEILTAVAGIPSDSLTGRHGPCPKCGGNDRFRLIDEQAGAILCNQCFRDRNGDGVAAIQWATGNDFKTALKLVGDYLGIVGSNGRRKAKSNGKANGQAKSKSKAGKREMLLNQVRPLSFLSEAAYTNIVSAWAESKPPITVEPVRQCRGKLVRWSNRRCLMLPGYADPRGGELTALLLYNLDASTFPAWGKLGERKMHLIRGSVNSWIVSGPVDTAKAFIRFEGPSCLLAAMSVGLPEGWVGITSTNGAEAVKGLDFSFIPGKPVYVAGDADEPGVRGQRAFAIAFSKAGATEVRILDAPYDVVPEHGKDWRDRFAEGLTTGGLKTIAEASPIVTAGDVAEWSKGKRASEKPEIIVTTNEEDVVDQAVQALRARSDIYQRGGVLCHVTRDTDPPKGMARPRGAPRIAILSRATLREKVASVAVWKKVRETEEGVVEEVIHPPGWAIDALSERGQWPGVPRLEAVVETPVFKTDGAILQEPGYDLASGILYEPHREYPVVPLTPTKREIQRAKDDLLEVVCDFPFDGDKYKSAWLSLVLTSLCRYGFYGPAPLGLVDSNVRGAGKGKLVDCVSLIVTGREMARMTCPTNNDEFRKVVTTIAIAGEPNVLFDNQNESVGCGVFDSVLTATTWSDRVLGTNKLVSGVPLLTTWFMTVNNATLRADTTRRCLWIRLKSNMETPEERSGFKHADLLAWVGRAHPRLVVAALTILRGYHVAGRPRAGLPPWGSYEPWSDLVREAVVWIGMPDPAETRRELTTQADVEAGLLRQLLAGWAEIDPEAKGVTVRHALDLAQNGEATGDYPSLRAAVAELAVGKDRKPSPRSLAMRLSHLRHRVADGHFFDKRDEHGTAVWMVLSLDNQGGSSCSSCSSPYPEENSSSDIEKEVEIENEKVYGVGISPTRTTRATDCLHQNVRETRTHDGYINRHCLDCEQPLPCRKA